MRLALIIIKLFAISVIVVALALLAWYGYLFWHNKTKVNKVNRPIPNTEEPIEEPELTTEENINVSSTVDSDITTQLLGTSASSTDSKDHLQEIRIHLNGTGSTTITSEDNHRYIINEEKSVVLRVPTQPTKNNDLSPVELFAVTRDGDLLSHGQTMYYSKKKEWTRNTTRFESSLLGTQGSDPAHVAWAADGVPVIYSPSNMFQSSYQLQSGLRPNGPLGRYDGSFHEDWVFKKGSGDLDECNGTTVGNQYVYVITNQYPIFPTCVWGTVDPSFKSVKTKGEVETKNTQDLANDLRPNDSSGAIEALDACSNKATTSPCQFESRVGTISGRCLAPPGESNLSCVPR